MEHRLRKLEMQYLELSERVTNVEDLLKSHIYYSSCGSQSKSTKSLSIEEFSSVSKRLAKVEKQLQNKRENAFISTHGVPNVGKENNNNGHFSPHGIVPLSSKKSYIMGQGGKPGPLMGVRSTQIPCTTEPQPLMEFQTSLVPNSSIYNGGFMKKFREILNKLNSGNFEKLSEEFLASVGPDINFSEMSNIVFNKAINEVDSPTMPAYYAQLMAKACNGLPNLAIELRKASMDHFSELFDSKEVSSSSSDVQLSEIAMAKRRNKGILRFIGELFKVGIVPFEDMKNFVDCLLLNPQESNLNHLCLMLKLTGSAIEDKSNAVDNNTATNVHSNHAQVAKWFDSVCAELDRKKDFCSNRTKFAIMDVLELRGKEWTGQDSSMSNAEKYVKSPKGSGGVWRETEQSFIEQFATGTAQQYTLFPVSNDCSPDNVQASMLNSSSQPMAYNQVVRKSINNVDSLELCASSSSSINTSCLSQTRGDTLSMQPLSESQLSLIRASNSRSPSVTASLDECSSTRTRNRRRNRPSKKLRDKASNPDTNVNSIIMPTTSNGFPIIQNPVNLLNVTQTADVVLLEKPIEDILNAYGTQMGTKKSQRYIWVQRRFPTHPTTAGKIISLVGEICRAAMHWTDKKKIAIAGSFLEALYLSGCISIDRIIESFRTVVTTELKKFTGRWPGHSRIAANVNIMGNIGSLLAETFVKEKDLNWLLSLKVATAGTEETDPMEEETFRLLSENVKSAIVAARGSATYTKLSSATKMTFAARNTFGEDSPVIQNCAMWNI